MKNMYKLLSIILLLQLTSCKDRINDTKHICIHTYWGIITSYYDPNTYVTNFIWGDVCDKYKTQVCKKVEKDKCVLWEDVR